jgi:hypothetical protein
MTRWLAAAALALAFAGITTAAASASEPALYECAKLGGGEFLDKLCTEGGHLGTGKYELREGVGKKTAFSGKNPRIRLDAKAVPMFCKNAKLSGQDTSPTTVGKVFVTLEKCTEVPVTTKVPCTSAGAPKSGTVVIGPLSGTLGYVNREAKEVGIALTREGGGPLTEYGCNHTSAIEYRLIGSLFALRTGEINTIGKMAGLDFNVGGAQSYEGGEPNVPTLVVLATGEEQTVHTERIEFSAKTTTIEVKA